MSETVKKRSMIKQIQGCNDALTTSAKNFYCHLGNLSTIDNLTRLEEKNFKVKPSHVLCMSSWTNCVTTTAVILPQLHHLYIVIYVTV